MNETKVTDIAIADDSEVIRNLIDEILRYAPALNLVGSFENGPEIVAWTRDGGRADIYLIDMRLPGLSGTATIRALRRFVPNTRIIAFSASAQESSVEAALAAGANQYVVKDSSLADLVQALESDARDVPAATHDQPSD
ncbi:MAG: response regulator transcription factor [Thermoleophilaceae bacterium]|nr:response regulator transcription factor [Thermoleophilaceae bacterium]